MATRKYDSTVARIAGNLLSGDEAIYSPDEGQRKWAAAQAVALARAIVAEVERTEPLPKGVTIDHGVRTEVVAHVCGLTGYNGMIDPPCPGCVAERTE